MRLSRRWPGSASQRTRVSWNWGAERVTCLQRCGRAVVWASIYPARMARLARQKHPHLEFRHVAAEDLSLNGETFDYIILSDFIVFLFDILFIFERLRAACNPSTRIVMHWYSRLWQPILFLAEKLKLKYPQPLINWTTVEDIRNLLHLTDFEVVQTRKHILLPKRLPLLTSFSNRYVAHLPVIQHLALTNWIVARPLGLRPRQDLPSVFGDLPRPQRSRQYRTDRNPFASDGLEYRAHLR